MSVVPRPSTVEQVSLFSVRSDVLGHILPVVGQAWAQSGVVCTYITN